MDAKETIAVIGAGLMGHGIAYLFAAAGHTVRVYDPAPSALASLPDRLDAIAVLLGHEADVPARVSGHETLAAAVDAAAYVFEAAPEVLDLKRSIFAELERHAPRSAILASNTSAIPISRIAAGASAPSRIVGTHFWNPPHLVPLVEVVQTDNDNLPAVDKTIALLKAAGRHPVHVKKDIPGFIGNRLQHALKREAIALVAAGVCDAETIDDVVKHGFGQRLAVLGPMEQSDLVGLDLTKNIHDTLMPNLDRTDHTHPLLERLVAEEHLGMKSGKGLREWTPEQAEAVRRRLRDFLYKQSPP